MRKILFFILASVVVTAQKTEMIDFSKSIKDDNKSIKSFNVIDVRDNKELGSVMYHQDQIDIVFKNNATEDLTNWFYKYNKEKGTKDLVLLLEKIYVSEDKKEKYSIGKAELRASTFLKRNDGYHFLYRKDTIATVSSRDTPYMSQSLTKKISLIFTDLIKKSYNASPWEYKISENELKDYSTLLKNHLEILKTNQLKDGVYKDYYSFFTHKPEPGFIIETNNKGVVTKAVKGNEKKPIRNFYAFVYNGVPFKVIPVGYVEIFRDELGLFIEVKKEELFPESNASFIMGGGLIGGLVGGLAVVAVDAIASKKRKEMKGTEVSLDPFTGNYILPVNFGKYK